MHVHTNLLAQIVQFDSCVFQSSFAPYNFAEDWPRLDAALINASCNSVRPIHQETTISGACASNHMACVPITHIRIIRSEH